VDESREQASAGDPKRGAYEVFGNRRQRHPFYSRDVRLSVHTLAVFERIFPMVRWLVLLAPAALLAGCISSSNPPPPAPASTVVVPQGSTVICSNGAPGPC
jgi:hypothetical protein